MASPLNRREALRLFSGAAFTLFGPRWSSASETPSVHVLTPELTEGPYYIDLESVRRDITEGRPGVPLRLRVRLEQLSSGIAIPDAAVDVWHCDAQGAYSGFNSHLPPPGHDGPMPGAGPDDFDDFFAMDGPPPGGPGHLHAAENKETFLRGVQFTNSSGVAAIDTIFPGWYPGRATHIHLRVHIGGHVADNRYEGGHISHTGQLFFPPRITDAVYRLPTYAKRPDGRRVLEDDDIYLQGGQTLTQLTLVDPTHLSTGLVADALIVIDPAAAPARV